MLIISIHIRKCAGTSFKSVLSECYGNKLLFDYGDETGSLADSSRSIRLQRQRSAILNRAAIERDKCIIHGHFFISKYDFLGVPKRYAVILRDPVERVISNYFYLAAQVDRKNADWRHFRDRTISLREYASLPEAKNVQTRVLEGRGLDQLDFIGLAEQMSASVALFNHVFAAKLPEAGRENVTPHSPERLSVPASLARFISEENSSDLELYRSAKERLDTDRKRLGI